ncbi:MAG: hypothetical protein ACRDF4_02230 [Rhabdochlamydiaceae bacterium]
MMDLEQLPLPERIRIKLDGLIGDEELSVKWEGTILALQDDLKKTSIGSFRFTVFDQPVDFEAEFVKHSKLWFAMDEHCSETERLWETFRDEQKLLKKAMENDLTERLVYLDELGIHAKWQNKGVGTRALHLLRHNFPTGHLICLLPWPIRIDRSRPKFEESYRKIVSF